MYWGLNFDINMGRSAETRNCYVVGTWFYNQHGSPWEHQLSHFRPRIKHHLLSSTTPFIEYFVKFKPSPYTVLFQRTSTWSVSRINFQRVTKFEEPQMQTDIHLWRLLAYFKLYSTQIRARTFSNYYINAWKLGIKVHILAVFCRDFNDEIFTSDEPTKLKIIHKSGKQFHRK